MCKGLKIKIEDWEILELARNYLYKHELLCKKVSDQYYGWMIGKRDIYSVMGSTLHFHRRKAKKLYIVIGLFYPPKDNRQTLLQRLGVVDEATSHNSGGADRC